MAVVNFKTKGNVEVAAGTGAVLATLAGPTGQHTIPGGAAGTFLLSTSNLGALAATTSAQLAGVISDETGSGALVFATSPTLVTPVLGVATATSVNKVAFTAPATGSTLTIADGKTLTASNTLTFTGTDATSFSLPATSGALPLANQGFFVGTTAMTIDRATAAQSLTGITSIDGYAAGLVGGLVGAIPYQTAVNTTAMLAAGTAGYLLQANGAAAPTWVAPAAASSVTVSDTNAAGTYNLVFTSASTGTATLNVDATTTPLTYDPSTNIVSANLAGNVTGNVTGLVNKVTLTAPATGSTITISDGKTFSVGNTVGFTGTDATSFVLPATSGSLPLDNQAFFLGTTSIAINRATGALALTGITSIDGTAVSLAGGLIGQVPYQSAAGVTAFLAAGTVGQVLTSQAGAAPTWTTPNSSTIAVTSVDTAGTLYPVFSTAGTSQTLSVDDTTTPLSYFPSTGLLTTNALTTVGNIIVGGDLTVNGTTTTVNSTTLAVADKNIEMGVVAVPSDATAGGGGITLKGTTDKTLIWDLANGNWTSSEDFNLVTGKVYKINNVNVLSATTLGSTVVGSSLTSVGTITTGVWNGTVVADAYIASALTGKTYNALTLTANATGFSVAGGTTSKTLTMDNTLTFRGTDTSIADFTTGGTVAYLSNKLSAFAATTSAELASVISDETGTGLVVFNTSPTLVTPLVTTGLYNQVATGGNLVLQPNSTDLTGKVSLPATTAATSYTTGALVIDGGVGIAGKVYTNNDITTSANLVTTAGIVKMPNSDILTFTTTSGTTGSAVSIASVPVATYNGVEFVVSGVLGSDACITKVLAISDGTSINYVEYGQVELGTSVLNAAGFAVSLVAGNITLTVNQATGSVPWKITAICNKV